MAFRTVVLAHEAEVHVHDGQLIVLTDERLTVPIEDIAVLVLESPRVNLSSGALSLLAGHGVATAVCDDKHMPTGILISNNHHSRQLTVTRCQLAATVPQKKRLWQRIVQAKIHNQATCLERLHRLGAPRMHEYAARVLSGDSTGLEATAARYYFPRLMPGIRRHSGEGQDGALDYGYAVVRAAIARALVSHGLYLPLGIHHDGQLNAFNLVDDLLEPFRPFADAVAVARDCRVDEVAGRSTLASVLNAPCVIEGETYSVLTGIEVCVISFVRALAKKDFRLLALPSFSDQSAVIDAAVE